MNNKTNHLYISFMIHISSYANAFEQISPTSPFPRHYRWYHCDWNRLISLPFPFSTFQTIS
ncbi:hypothetical protein Hanom_Chr15g01374851 [Helianthus anomalus]